MRVLNSIDWHFHFHRMEEYIHEKTNDRAGAADRQRKRELLDSVNSFSQN